MGVLAEMRRRDIQASINLNPTSITIQRTERVDAGGYFEEVTSTHGPFTVRLFQRTSSVPQETTTLAGAKQTDASWSLLATDDADIQAGSDALDEFEASIGRCQVVAVFPQRVEGELVGYQALLEVVS